MQAARQAARLQRELERLGSDPPPGACVWPADDKLLTRLEAQLQGPEHTVYAGGMFRMEIQIPERYPFEPPSMRFKTPIYHPNIDNGGRICLDLLNMPPKGSWKPSLNLSTLLTSIRLLLSEPNPDDGLMAEITAEYKHDRASFNKTALEWTAKHASDPAKHGSTTDPAKHVTTRDELPHARQDERQPGADAEQQGAPGVDKHTEVVSDSGSEEENEPSSSWKGSSRLSLSQRSLALKRRKY